ARRRRPSLATNPSREPSGGSDGDSDAGRRPVAPGLRQLRLRSPGKLHTRHRSGHSPAASLRKPSRSRRDRHQLLPATRARCLTCVGSPGRRPRPPRHSASASESAPVAAEKNRQFPSPQPADTPANSPADCPADYTEDDPPSRSPGAALPDARLGQVFAPGSALAAKDSYSLQSQVTPGLFVTL